MFLVEVLQKSLPNSLYLFVVKSLLARPAWLGYACVALQGFWGLAAGVSECKCFPLAPCIPQVVIHQGRQCKAELEACEMFL